MTASLANGSGANTSSAADPWPGCKIAGMKPRNAILPIAGLAIPAILAPFAHADETFRCGKWIVSSDLAIEELVERCGPPTTRESESEDILVRNQYGLMVKNGVTVTEKWTYDRGTQAPPMVVTIVDGKIRSIVRQR